MSQNKITFTITLDEDADPTRVGIAIGQLIKTLTPSEEWGAVAESLKAQADQQMKVLRNATTGEPIDMNSPDVQALMTETESKLFRQLTVAIEIAIELLAEASNKATREDWLTLVLAKTHTRCQELSQNEITTIVRQMMGRMIDASRKEALPTIEEMRGIYPPEESSPDA